jgi:hypothetical protein
MKKNKMMRLASAMMVMTLMTTSVISGTFAKYVTSNEAFDVARVAKWGVQISASGTEETFDFQYDTKNAGDVVKVGSKSVISSTNADGTRSDVVAPGTEGTLGAIVLSGAPEVAVEVKYEADLKLEGWTLASDSTVYFQIIITVGAEKFTFTTSLADLETAVENAIGSYTNKYPANTDLSTVAVPSVTWEWPFEVGSTPAEIAANDVKDTELGDLSAQGAASWITLDITATATQID